jgi:hypothetical protein
MDYFLNLDSLLVGQDGRLHGSSIALNYGPDLQAGMIIGKF